MVCSAGVSHNALIVLSSMGILPIVLAATNLVCFVVSSEFANYINYNWPRCNSLGTVDVICDK